MAQQLHVLLVEDSEDDALFIIKELQRGGYEPVFQRVHTAPGFNAALAAGGWDVIIADYNLPEFSGVEALGLLQRSGIDLPFVIVSGAIGEDVAVAAMKTGAHDYILKSGLARLVPAVERELRDAQVRREQRQAEGYIAALSKLGQTLSAASTPIEAARVIGDITDQLFGWDAFTLDLYDADHDRLQTVLNVDILDGTKQDVPCTYEMRRPSGIANQIIQSGKQLILKSDPTAMLPDAVPFGSNPPRPSASIMYAPIRHEDRVIAILSLHSYQSQAYDQKKLNTFQTLADYCTGALGRIRAREELRESEERYRKLADSSPIGIFETDAEGRCTYVNARWSVISGMNFQDSRGYGWMKATHREDRRAIQEQWLETVAQGLEWAREYRLLTPKGDVRWVRVRAGRLLSPEGRCTGYVGTVEDITDRKLAEEDLRTSREQLRALAAHLQSVREEERKRITREIHDELGQSLTGFKMDLAWIRARLQPAEEPLQREPILDKIGTMSALLDGTANLVRKICTELRPGILDDLGLTAAIEWQAREYQRRTGIICETRLGLGELLVDSERSTALFRIFQEILTNIARHARATRAEVHLKVAGSRILLEVKDNGKGIKLSEKAGTKSLGLLGMRERAHILGGQVEIEGEPGKGTTVTVTVPLPHIQKSANDPNSSAMDGQTSHEKLTLYGN